jgi:hypothetical protein
LRQRLIKTGQVEVERRFSTATAVDAFLRIYGDVAHH